MTQLNTPGRRERKKAETQRHIVNCAMKLYRAEGFDNTTMEAIAEEADVAKRTLYSYFPAKEAIVSAFWLSNVAQKSELLPQLLAEYPNTHSRLTAIFVDAAEGFKAEPEFARIHFGYQLQQLGKSKHPLVANDFTHFLSAIMEAGQAENDIRNDIPAAELALQSMLNFTAICLIWFSDINLFSLDQRLSQSVDCFIEGAGNK